MLTALKAFMTPSLYKRASFAPQFSTAREAALRNTWRKIWASTCTMLVKQKEKLIVGNASRANKFYVARDVNSLFPSFLRDTSQKIYRRYIKAFNEVPSSVDQSKSIGLDRTSELNAAHFSRVDRSMPIRKWILSERQAWNLRNVIVHGTFARRGGRRTNYIKGPHTAREKGQVAAPWRGRNIYDFAMTMPGDLPLRRALNRSFRMKRIGGSTASTTWVVARGWGAARARGFGDSSRFISGPHFLHCGTTRLILSSALAKHFFKLHFSRSGLILFLFRYISILFIWDLTCLY